MFLKKSSKSYKGKTYVSYTLTESYREQGKVKHRNLYNLGDLTDAQAEQFRLVLQVQGNPSLIVTHEEDLLVTQSLSYLNVMALHHLWRQWRLEQFFVTDRWVEALVINRCVNPTSKIKLQSWAVQSVLPAVIPSLRTYDEYDVYRELDRLAKQEDDLQVFLYQQLVQRQKMSTDAFFYDITSSYFEGSHCVIAKLGYSRDHRPDREQIVIGLMITPEGYPFYWRVLEGNTQDVTTIESLVVDVKNRFGIEHCKLVFDRGMVSAANLQAIEKQSFHYVSAMDQDEIRMLLLDKVMPEAATPENWEQVLALQEFQPFDEQEFLFFRQLEVDGTRYIVTFDVQRFYDQTKHRKRQIQAVMQGIEQTNTSLKNAKKARKREIVERDALKILSRKGFKKQAEISVEPISIEVTSPKGTTRTVQSFHIQLKWLEDRIRDAARLDGLTCFITNMTADEMNEREVIVWYRRKNKVEEAFREMKSHLQLRPMHVTREQRVRAHVTICMLANFLTNDMEQQLTATGIQTSPQEVLAGLASCQVHQLEVPTLQRKMLKVQEISQQQQQWLQALHCEEIGKDSFKKQVLKQVEQWV